MQYSGLWYVVQIFVLEGERSPKLAVVSYGRLMSTNQAGGNSHDTSVMFDDDEDEEFRSH